MPGSPVSVYMVSLCLSLVRNYQTVSSAITKPHRLQGRGGGGALKTSGLLFPILEAKVKVLADSRPSPHILM